jgi:hypothetical protein
MYPTTPGGSLIVYIAVAYFFISRRKQNTVFPIKRNLKDNNGENSSNLAINLADSDRHYKIDSVSRAAPSLQANQVSYMRRDW